MATVAAQRQIEENKLRVGEEDPKLLEHKYEELIQKRAFLDGSINEMKDKISELEEKIENPEHNDNEWRVRYETQTEYNQYLEQQAVQLRERINLLESWENGDNGLFENLDAMNEVKLSELIQGLMREKDSLLTQLRDFDWRLEQEAKSFYIAHEARKVFLTDVSHTSRFYTSDALMQSADSEKLAKENIAPDQRILDPKKPPINKKATVKRLPKLDGDLGTEENGLDSLPSNTSLDIANATWTQNRYKLEFPPSNIEAIKEDPQDGSDSTHKTHRRSKSQIPRIRKPLSDEDQSQTDMRSAISMDSLNESSTALTTYLVEKEAGEQQDKQSKIPQAKGKKSSKGKSVTAAKSKK